MARVYNKSGQRVAGPAPRIIDRDHGYQRTLQVFRQLRLSLSLGVVGPKAAVQHEDADGKPSGLTVGELAAIHELGLGVPERSWLRAWFEENHETVVRDIKAALPRVIKGQQDPEALLNALGAKYAGMIQERIARGIDPPLAESTIARKGSSTPLIDTGQLRSAITWEVRRLANSGEVSAFARSFNAARGK